MSISGAAPILDLTKAGVEVALGCDNYSCAETQNIFIAMRMLCLLPAITSPEPHPVTAAHALKAATLTGAKAVNMDGQIGALKPGMAADLMILDLNEPAFVPFNSASRQLVFSECGGSIDTVLVAGTKTNVCCESTARDAMMLNFNTVMITDGNAANTDDDHNAALNNFYLTFGDIMSTDFAIECLKRNAGKKLVAAE